MNDALVLSQQIAPYVTAAISSYGTAVLTRSIDLSADGTVSLGQRLLDKILRRSAEQSSQREAVTSALQDLAGNPSDPDLQAVVRVQLKKLLMEEPELIRELSDIVAKQGTTIVASGDRSVAAHTINGGVHTGDCHG
ncbi:hypothetical protein [Streptomyces sp. NBC_00893]|uniref:hypothetical protein n=1 Tax=Streptomyces sp. NBC_00893 TaxID=2975862 RepID=UPI00225255B0|nr:hypothetical protein [Streptomyces sp. NBC_00893]MCX4847375.1 hypothetical protein [Streptomyces sp. NBC_00893]